VHAVLDPNVLLFGVLSSGGATADVLRACDGGEFELLLSPALLAALERALSYPKLRRRVRAEDAQTFVGWVQDVATIVPDPRVRPSVHSADPGDDYLIALAASQRAALVSGDKHLLALAGEIPVLSAREFLELLSDGT
jgi:putative PIN family toxin of toxin-antitoxin system